MAAAVFDQTVIEIDAGRVGLRASGQVMPLPATWRFTLVRELGEKGVGWPSTYATILSTIQDRGYVEKKEGRLGPTELGVVVNGLLVVAQQLPRRSLRFVGRFTS